jgi:Family of unknown function (DUF6206)
LPTITPRATKKLRGRKTRRGLPRRLRAAVRRPRWQSRKTHTSIRSRPRCEPRLALRVCQAVEMLQEQARNPLGARFEVDVERLDAAVEAAIREGRPRGLRVLGYGEITLVVGWPSDDPVVAVKRLPPFPDTRRLDAYADLLQRYVEILKERGVAVVETEICSHSGIGRAVRAYLVQPFVPRERHLNALLRTAAGEYATELLLQAVDNVCRCVDREVGFDAQAANWFLEDGRLVCFDVSTPMLCGPDGRE